MAHVTCRLTAKNRDQLRNLRSVNLVWATFTCNNQQQVGGKPAGKWLRAGARIITYAQTDGQPANIILGHDTIAILWV